jgi:hypothetical protein
LTLEVIVRPGSVPASLQSLFFFTHGTYALSQVDSNNRFAFGVSVSSTPYAAESVANSYTVGQKYCVTGTFDGLNATLYVNGHPAAVVEAPGSVDANPTAPLTFGQATLGGFGYRGTMDEAALYSVALDPTVIAQHAALADCR